MTSAQTMLTRRCAPFARLLLLALVLTSTGACQSRPDRVVLVAPGVPDTAIFENAIREAAPMADRQDNPYRAMMNRAAEVIEHRMKGAVDPSVLGEVIARAATGWNSPLLR